MRKLVVDIMQEIVSNVSVAMLPVLQAIQPAYTGVRFDYGHPADIVSKLANYSATEAFRYQKYPLIGLFLDFPQTMGQSAGVESATGLNLFIAVGTDPKYTPQQRTDATFKPLLYPIKDELIRQMLLHPSVVTPSNRKFTHTHVDRYQWGKGGLEYYNNGQKNTFNDFIDAIELLNFQIEFVDDC